ncbi:Pentraxin-related protein PTX3 [Larimichthys crocea]|uniref:Pentraxin-related protein PTX3 n=1 Tax=Larimichthys crocea TaxID=215358 RepID=A0A6G0IG07_LARCR|nr:Pentraxin-related protein PTX3 [Larimichthys crocea]
MHVFRIWRVLCVLGFVGASLCMNDFEYEGNYAENYDNEISQDQQEGETPTTPCQATDFSRWDKLFIALEDSQMRQNMLLESLEQCSGGMVSLKNRVDKLAKGTCQQCLPSLESACRAQSEQTSVRLQQGLAELRREEEDRERILNATLQQLLHSSREGNARLRQLEDGLVPSGTAHGDGAPTNTQTWRFRRCIWLGDETIPIWPEEAGSDFTPGHGRNGKGFGCYSNRAAEDSSATEQSVMEREGTSGKDRGDT